MKKLLIGISLAGLIFTFNSCSDSGEEEEIDPCLNGPVITIDQITNSIEGQDDGVILSSATGGKSPYTFSIDDTNFQTGGAFANLGGGNYNVTVKDANECTSSTSAEVKEIPFVSFADEVNPIIQNNCQIAGCHGENTNIPDFSTYENIDLAESCI